MFVAKDAKLKILETDLRASDVGMYVTIKINQLYIITTQQILFLINKLN